MNRFSLILFWAGVIVATVFMLYKVKYEVQSIKTQIAEITKEISGERESLRVAAAEWAYLNRPERLRRLTDKYLTAKSLTADQVAEVEAIAFQSQSLASADGNDIDDDDVRAIVASYRNSSAR